MRMLRSEGAAWSQGSPAPGASKEQAVPLPPEPPGASASLAPGFSLVVLISAFRPPELFPQGANSCCFQAPSLGRFVMAVLGHSRTQRC